MPTLRKISIEYDALGRPVKTVNPDGSEQLVVYGKPKSVARRIGGHANKPHPAHL